MIEAIEKIDRVGVLNGFEGGAHPLARLSLIYAGNGCGKSTLSAVLAAAGSGTTRSLDERRTLGATGFAHVRIRTSDGRKRVLNAGAWSGDPLDMRVFDSDFVDNNVHTGGEVNPSHRQGLLDIAIGTSAVQEQANLEQAREKVLAAKAEKDRLQAEILAMAHAVDSTSTFDAFQQMPVSQTGNSSVDEAETALINGRNISKIYALPLPPALGELGLDANLEKLSEVLGKSLSTLHASARMRVAEHLSHLDSGSPEIDVEEWARKGVTISNVGECPFCGQSTIGVDLIDLYSESFDSAYGDLRGQIHQLKTRLGEAARQQLLEQVRLEYERAATAVAAWKTHVDVGELPPLRPVMESVDGFGAMFDGLLQSKIDDLETPVEDDGRQEALRAWATRVNEALNDINKAITLARSGMDGYKRTLAVAGLPRLEANLRAARLTQLRAAPEVQALLITWADARREVAKRESEATEARQSSKVAMNATLATFEGLINDHLQKMHAQFRIEKVNSTYAGGAARGSYVLRLRDTPIDISRGVPPFRVALSEGDKRGLAFAFFCAAVSAEEDLRGVVIVVDDPVTSLDKHRRTHTTNALDEFSRRGAQVIVLAHDATYLREVREKFERNLRDHHGAVRNFAELQLVRRSGGDASLRPHDLDRECESTYFRHYRQIRSYLEIAELDGALVDHTAAGQAIRPLVESYLHRRFPGRIQKEYRTLGAVIRRINDAADDDVLAYARHLTAELIEVNEFGMRYHHDTDSDINSPEPDPDEVRAFAERAMRIVHGDPAL